jgi:hypothetical protein
MSAWCSGAWWMPAQRHEPTFLVMKLHIKIDQSLVSNIAIDSSDIAIV